MHARTCTLHASPAAYLHCIVLSSRRHVGVPYTLIQAASLPVIEVLVPVLLRTDACAWLCCRIVRMLH